MYYFDESMYIYHHSRLLQPSALFYLKEIELSSFFNTHHKQKCLNLFSTSVNQVKQRIGIIMCV
jgi:hypothetical protein